MLEATDTAPSASAATNGGLLPGAARTIEPDRLPEALFEGIAARAVAADRGERDLSADLAELAGAGLLAMPLPRDAGGLALGGASADALALARLLRRLGRANLSVARLYEGHVNAAKLVALYGDGPARARAWRAVGHGALMGVWGADGDPPLSLGADGRLAGTKRFASGLGLVRLAVVSIAGEAGLRLALVPTGEPTREDASGWRVAGMRATASGTYDFAGVEPIAMLGEVGDYVREPHFEGGTWRYCAAHLGGAEALADETRRMLVRSKRADDPHQRDRLARMGIACETARLWIESAAARVEGDPADPEGAAAYALLAREATERACLEVIDLCERALGMLAHAETTPIDRMRRDLSMFLRQAAPDAKRMRAATALVERDCRAETLGGGANGVTRRAPRGRGGEAS